MEQIEQRLAALEKQSKRKTYNKDYYKRKKEKVQVAEQACLVLERYETPTKMFNMSGTDYHRYWRLNPGLESPLVKWTNKLREFIADKRSVDNYLEWLGWSWNHDTYVTQPVVKSGGRYARFVGMDCKGKPQRVLFTERDFTGRVKAHKSRFKEFHSDVIASAIWYDYAKITFGMICSKYGDDECWFHQMPKDYTKVLQVSRGGIGEFVLHKGKVFGQHEKDFKTMGEMYTYAMPSLKRAWRATLDGFNRKSEPFA